MIFKKFFNKDADKVDFFAKEFNLSTRVTELILSRGINTSEKISEFLNPHVFFDPFDLKGMKALCDRLKIAREMGDKVLVFGDYDVDGVSATAIMLKALAKFGIKANFFLPNRYIDGYGLTTVVVDKLVEKFCPDLIITVDCGISCYNEVEYAKTKGVEIIVTDHHEIPEILPDTIVIDAKIEGQKYQFNGLCGTGVAFKIAQALLGEKEAEEFLPIAAIATIADIVPLQSENRTIVANGLKMFDKLPIGLKMLLKEYGISLNKPSSTDISFKIAPKINASGRMGDAGDSLKLYLETDPIKNKKYIEKLQQHNTRRQEICNKIYEDAEKALAKQDLKNLRVICLASKTWDQGVLGIVCSRLVDKYHKPVFLFSQEGELLRGSGRSIDDINIHALLSSLKNILETFGGHSMAAGLAIKREKYQEFIQKVNSFALENVNDEVFIPIEYYDQELTEEEITPEFIKSLDALEPFGCDNPKPKFKITSNNVEITPMRRFYQHANVKIGNFELTYFNFLNNINKIKFSRAKSFIFEFQDKNKGVVDFFDGGSFIAEDSYKKLNAIEFNQLLYKGKTNAKYTLYPNENLLNFVGGSTTTVFGTCFVTYSCSDFVDFTKKYNIKGIYHFGIYDSLCNGINSVLLSPKGTAWAKNFNKIIFLSPVLDTDFISALNEVTNAEIYVPIDRKVDGRNFINLELSRETFGQIYKALSNKNIKGSYNVFELFDALKLPFDINFNTFYCALKTFEQLQLLTLNEKDMLYVETNKTIKKQLEQSQFFNALTHYKNSYRRGN